MSISLKETMNKIASDTSIISDDSSFTDYRLMNCSKKRSKARREAHLDISGLSEYLGTDDVILGLLKSYIDHRARYNSLLLSNGKCDPMTEVAATVLDSAYNALKARVAELKRDKSIIMKLSLLKQRILRGSSKSAKGELRFLSDRNSSVHNLAGVHGPKAEGDGGFLSFFAFLAFLALYGGVIRKFFNGSQVLSNRVP